MLLWRFALLSRLTLQPVDLLRLRRASLAPLGLRLSGAEAPRLAPLRRLLVTKYPSLKTSGCPCMLFRAWRLFKADTFSLKRMLIAAHTGLRCVSPDACGFFAT